MELVSIAVVKDKVNLSVSTSELTHLVLSEKLAYKKLKVRYGLKNIFGSVQNVLVRKWNGQNLHVETNIFYSVYENGKQY